MQGKVTLEDHFATTSTLADSQILVPTYGTRSAGLLDFQDTRLRLMDAADIEIMVASLNAPAVQAIHDVKRATAVAREANDVLAQEVARRPDRFVGVAALAMQDPDGATAELERCVKDLGFRARSSTASRKSDRPLPRSTTTCRNTGRSGAWSRASTFPFYLHPRNPLPARSRATRAIPGSWGRTGRSTPRPRCMPCG